VNAPHWALGWVTGLWLPAWLDTVPSLAVHASALRLAEVGADRSVLVADAHGAAQDVAFMDVLRSQWRISAAPTVYSGVYLTAEEWIAETVFIDSEKRRGMVWLREDPQLLMAQQCAREVAMALVLRRCWEAAMVAVDCADPVAPGPVIEPVVRRCVSDVVGPVAERLSDAADGWGSAT
jgi:hypothetical protein